MSMEPPAVDGARNHSTLSNPGNQTGAYSAFHKPNFTGFAFYCSSAQLFSFEICSLHPAFLLAPRPRPSKLASWWSGLGAVRFSLLRE